jgi:hypothetical protein
MLGIDLRKHTQPFFHLSTSPLDSHCEGINPRERGQIHIGLRLSGIVEKQRFVICSTWPLQASKSTHICLSGRLLVFVKMEVT